jgi:hypothetical protein
VHDEREVGHIGPLVGWVEIWSGCEERVLRLFDEVVAYYGEKLGGRSLTGFEPFLLAAHGAGLRGFAVRTREISRLAREA